MAVRGPSLSNDEPARMLPVRDARRPERPTGSGGRAGWWSPTGGCRPPRDEPWAPHRRRPRCGCSAGAEAGTPAVGAVATSAGAMSCAAFPAPGSSGGSRGPSGRNRATRTRAATITAPTPTSVRARLRRAARRPPASRTAAVRPRVRRAARCRRDRRCRVTAVLHGGREEQRGRGSVHHGRDGEHHRGRLGVVRGRLLRGVRRVGLRGGARRRDGRRAGRRRRHDVGRGGRCGKREHGAARDQVRRRRARWARSPAARSPSAPRAGSAPSRRPAAAAVSCPGSTPADAIVRRRASTVRSTCGAISRSNVARSSRTAPRNSPHRIRTTTSFSELSVSFARVHARRTRATGVTSSGSDFRTCCHTSSSRSRPPRSSIASGTPSTAKPPRRRPCPAQHGRVEPAAPEVVDRDRGTRLGDGERGVGHRARLGDERDTQILRREGGGEPLECERRPRRRVCQGDLGGLLALLLDDAVDHPAHQPGRQLLGRPRLAAELDRRRVSHPTLEAANDARRVDPGETRGGLADGHAPVPGEVQHRRHGAAARTQRHDLRVARPLRAADDRRRGGASEVDAELVAHRTPSLCADCARARRDGRCARPINDAVARSGHALRKPHSRTESTRGARRGGGTDVDASRQVTH